MTGCSEEIAAVAEFILSLSKCSFAMTGGEEIASVALAMTLEMV